MESRNSSLGCILPVIALAVVALVIGFFVFVEMPPGTKACAVTKVNQVVRDANGNPEVIGPGGFYIMSPDKGLVCYDVTRKTMELVAGEPSQSNSKADYVDYAIKARTKDGIDLYSMSTTQYHVDPSCTGTLYPLIKDDEAVKEQVVKARLRSIIPQQLSTYGALEQYQGNITAISNAIEDQLRAELNANCVALDYFELKRGDFDDRYEENIRNRAAEVEKAEKVKLEQVTAAEEAKKKKIDAEAEADRLQTQARAAADKQKIEVQAAAERVAIETEAANKKRIADADAAFYEKKKQAEGEKALLDARGEALTTHPELIEYQRINTISGAGAIYLPSDVLPLWDVPEMVKK